MLVEPASAGLDRGDPRLVAQPRLVGLVGAQAERPDQRGEGEPLADEGHQHGEEGAEQQQVAVGERLAAVGDQRQGEDRGQADDPAGAGPAQDDDLAAGEPVRGAAVRRAVASAVAVELLAAEPGVQRPAAGAR